jgi:RNA polymerase sigma factor (sigma-70 family)
VEYAITRGVAAGDAAIAFDDLFASAYHRVVGAVAVVTGDEALAEDAAQEAFARAHGRWSRVGRLDRPDLWVTRVALRVAIDAWRRRRRESPLSATVPAAVPDDIQRLWVRWNLAGLSPMQRATVLMHHSEGRPIADIAAHLQRSPNTIRSHLAAARRRLRRAAKEED